MPSLGCHATVPFTLAARDVMSFWAHVEQGEGCWLWQGRRGPQGYGSFSLSEGTSRLAHRVAYQIAHGAIPQGMLVMHTCDTPSCVRPAHLWIGTQADNLRDMRRKGRAPDMALVGRKGAATKALRGLCKSGRHALRADNVGRTACGTRYCIACKALVAGHDRSIRRAARHEEFRASIAPFLPESREMLTAILGERDADVLCRHFGLYGQKREIQRVIAADLGIGRERVRQLAVRALHKIGAPALRGAVFQEGRVLYGARKFA